MKKLLSLLCLILTLSSFAFSQNIEENFKLALKEKDKNKKLALYDQIINAAPEFASAYFNRGIIYLSNKNWAEAKLDFKKFIVLEPKKLEGYINLSVAFYESEDYLSALTYSEQALKLNSTSIKALKNRVMILEKMNKSQDAITEISILISVNNDPELKLLRASIYENLGKTKEVLEDLNKYLEVMPGKNIIRYKRANILLKSDNLTEAINDFIFLTKDGNDYKDSFKKLGIIFYKLKDYSKTTQYLEQHLKSNPSEIDSLQICADSYIYLNNFEKVLVIYDEILKHDETKVEYLLKKAEVNK
ncbi:MAG: hypothetical protein ACD_79C00263G0001, partial [uncultured bacterium]